MTGFFDALSTTATKNRERSKSTIVNPDSSETAGVGFDVEVIVGESVRYKDVDETEADVDLLAMVIGK